MRLSLYSAGPIATYHDLVWMQYRVDLVGLAMPRNFVRMVALTSKYTIVRTRIQIQIENL